MAERKGGKNRREWGREEKKKGKGTDCEDH